MKFIGLRHYSGEKSLEALVKYVRVDLYKSIKDLFAGLSKLSFRDNFDCYFQDVSIAALGSVTFANRLKTPDVIWFPVRLTGNAHLVETEVGADFITLENISSSIAITATILVMRR